MGYWWLPSPKNVNDEICYEKKAQFGDRKEDTLCGPQNIKKENTSEKLEN